MKLKIYQADLDCEWKFNGYRYFKKCVEHCPDWFAEYRLEYSNDNFPDNMSLEDIYCMFNQDDRPNSKTMHSVSMSDIIEMDGVPYYVDNIGFAMMEKFTK